LIGEPVQPDGARATACLQEETIPERQQKPADGADLKRDAESSKPANDIHSHPPLDSAEHPTCHRYTLDAVDDQSRDQNPLDSQSETDDEEDVQRYLHQKPGELDYDAGA
jgi:hypothetical protein